MSVAFLSIDFLPRLRLLPFGKSGGSDDHITMLLVNCSRRAAAGLSGFSGELFPIFRKYFQNLGNGLALIGQTIFTKSLFSYDLADRASCGIGIA
jgi:hypothetical protein